MSILDEGASELERLAPSFRLHLKAETLSAKTIETWNSSSLISGRLA